MHRPLWPLAATLAGAVAFTAPAAAYDEADLATKLGREMRLAGPAAGALVRDLDSGQEVFALRENQPRIPASVDKLYTTSTALLALGAATTLDTTVVASGAVDVFGSLRGNLYLVGGGDPFFGRAGAGRLAQAVRDAGIRRIDGAVIGDDSLFDARRSSRRAGYDPELGGVLSALAFERGIARGRPRLDAARFGAQRLAGELRAVGIHSTRRSRAGVAPDATAPLTGIASLPVRTLIRSVNVSSDNFAAEMLLKVIGAQIGGDGSTSTGAEIVRDTLDDFGVRPRVIDGSGLSREDRTTPRQVVRLLERMHGQDVAESFRSSLAVAGATGTLKRRLRGTPAARRCRAKTGTLRDVSTLAGYCRTRGARNIAFAFLFNRVNPFGARRVQDRMTAAIARLDAGAPAGPAGPGVGPTGPAGDAGQTASGGQPAPRSTRRPASSRTGTSSRSALASLVPGDAPATR